MLRILNNIKFFLITAIIAFGFYGCTDEIRYNTNSPNLVIEGYISSDETTRTLHIDDGESVHVAWAANDYIGLIPAETGGHFQYSAKESSGTTEFSPVEDEIENLEGQTIYAYYPYNNETSDDNRIVITNTNSQGKNMLNFFDVMIAKGIVEDNRLSLNFKHIFAFLKVTIKTSLLKPYSETTKFKKLLIEGKKNPLSFCNSDNSYPHYNLITDSIEADRYINFLWYGIGDEFCDKEYVTFYVAILPSSEQDEIAIMTSATNERESTLMEKKTPATGFKAGHVYEVSIEQDEIIEVMDNERQALIDFYNATGGDNWINNTNWCSDRPISEWYGIQIIEDYWGSNKNTVDVIRLKNNNLTGEIPASIANLKNLFVIDLKENYLTGNIPENIISNSGLFSLELNFNCLSGTVPEKVTSDPRWEERFRDLCCIQREGYKLDFPVYRSSDYSEDKNVITLQHHTKGKGLKLYILGEMYTDRDIADGTYMDHVEKSMGYFFSKEPFTNFRDYFDVYCVNVVSSTEVIGMDTPFETAYSAFYPDLVCEYIKDLQGAPTSLSDISVLVLLKTSAINRNTAYLYNDGLSVAFIPVDLQIGNTFESLESHIKIVLCGYGFGKLADEVIPSVASLDKAHQKNWWMNIDEVNDTKRIIWSYFINDPRYKNEKIGIYDCGNGLYRATEESIMRFGRGKFNAPSRRSIYQRIMELSGEGYSFEKFLEYDEINRQMIDNALMSRSSKDTELDIRTLTEPPVYYDYPSSEIGKH